MRGGHNRRITTEQREEILRVFLTEGEAAAMVLARPHGLNRYFARKLACERGYRPIHVPTGTLHTEASA